MKQRFQGWLANRLVGRKNFSGNLMDRMRGLDMLWPHCPGSTVLDVACSDGLIGYECARHGACLVHGLERDWGRVVFARRLFRDLPIESHFLRADLAVTAEAFQRRHGDPLLDSYDIVLFLGITHKLARQLPENVVHGLIDFFIDKAGTWFVHRGEWIVHFEGRLLGKGFCLHHASPGVGGRGGPLQIYRRVDAETGRN